ncbi:MAG: ABC transporter permease [Bdellovibrionaceae bacterium]|nr:ABC transporter permease [Pseudobdellovibrionaceae bacterium]
MKSGVRLGGPALAWLCFFILAPLGLVLLISFAQRGIYGGIQWDFGAGNYSRLFSPETLLIVWDSLRLAFFTAVVCVFLGLLSAWAMATASEKRRPWLLGLIALPFLTNLIIRVYAVKSVVAANGPLPFLLTSLGIEFDPFALTANSWLVAYGMISSYLPFAVLPLYGAFEKFDFTLVEAAQDLGAGPWKIFGKVIVPALRGPILGAFLLVFIPCLGEYVIPDLLGGAKSMLLGNLITDQFLKARDWPFGAAVSVGMMGLLVLTGLLLRVLRRTK